MNYQQKLSLPVLICLTTSVSATHTYTCQSCCTPSSFKEALPAIIDIPCAIIAFLAVFIWYSWVDADYVEKKRVAFDESFQYSGTIPYAGVFDYKVNVWDNEWVQKSNCKIKFIDSVIVEIEGLNYRDIPEKFDTRITDSSKMVINAGTNPLEINDFICYLTQVPGSDKPGFVGFHSKISGTAFVLLPDECQTETSVLFPAMKSNFLKLYFILIVFMIGLSIMTFCLTRDSFFYSSYYLSYALGYPWGAFVSCFGIIIFIIFTNPFGCKTVNKNFIFPILVFYLALAVICLTFSILDYTYAGFIDDNNLVDTRSPYTLDDHQQELENSCQFNQYDCSVTYSANLTLRTDSCQDDYILQCVSFDTENNSCSQERNKFYSLFVFQGLLEFCLAMFWWFVSCLWVDYSSDKRFNISRNLEEMNGRKVVNKDDIPINSINHPEGQF